MTFWAELNACGLALLVQAPSITGRPSQAWEGFRSPRVECESLDWRKVNHVDIEGRARS